MARAELAMAFAGLRITWSNRRDARYRVRVVQELRDPRLRRTVHVAGQSWAVSGFGGHGAVSFLLLASSAVGFAPDTASREAVIDAIGRGVGRAAVHEFTHQFLPRALLHQTTDRASYEYASAAREAQYFGPMHWDLAWAQLRRRLGP